MATNEFLTLLKKRKQIQITVKGRRTGRAITVPVWFVVDENSLWLLPVYGSRTQWYRNLEVNPALGVKLGDLRRRLRARLVTDATAVKSIVRRFRDKYTPEQIKRWYRGLDVAVEAPLRKG